MERRLAARVDELKALQEKHDAEARQRDDAQARMQPRDNATSHCTNVG